MLWQIGWSRVLNPEKWVEYFREKLPTRNGAVHYALRQIFEQVGFKFEELKQGDARFYLVRKRFREAPQGQSLRRLVIVPGFGDSPASWLPVFTYALRDLEHSFDEVVVLDFPGYLGFLSSQTMVPSMDILLNVTKMMCEVYPPTVLMGHSLGGWLAAKTAQSMPKLMDHLVLVSPSGLIPNLDERDRFGKFILSNQGLGIDQLLRRILHAPKKYHEFLSDDVQKFFSKEEVKEFVNSVGENHFIDQRKPFSAKKLTVIWGENDEFVPSSGMRDWVDFYGTYLDAYIIKDAGHVPQLERPFVTADVIFHAILGKPYKENDKRLWKKIQARRQEWTNAKLDAPVPSSVKLLTADSKSN